MYIYLYVHMFMFMFLAIGIERYIGIFRPLQYDVLVTGRKLAVVICVVWVYSFIVAMPTMTGAIQYEAEMMCAAYIVFSNTYNHFISAHIFVCIIVMSTIYIVIFNSLQKNQRRTSASEMVSEAGHISRKNLRILKSFAMVVGVFSFCWLPLVILLQLKYLGVDVYNDTWYQVAYNISQILLLANSAANPFICEGPRGGVIWSHPVTVSG